MRYFSKRLMNHRMQETLKRVEISIFQVLTREILYIFESQKLHLEPCSCEDSKDSTNFRCPNQNRIIIWINLWIWKKLNICSARHRSWLATLELPLKLGANWTIHVVKFVRQFPSRCRPTFIDAYNEFRDVGKIPSREKIIPGRIGKMI